MLYAGLDIGTSTSKLVVYDRFGNELFKQSCKYSELGTGGQRELNPRDVIAAVDQLLLMLGQSSVGPVRALAIASLGESFICVDADGQPLCNSMVTGDKRGEEQTARLVERFGAVGIMERTGLVPSELYSLPKLMWLHENTDCIQRTNHVYFYEDYFCNYLTGTRVLSHSSASRSMAFDIVRNQWIGEYLGLAGLQVDQFSSIVPSGTVIGTITADVARHYALSPEMLIVAGCHDQAAAALGSGLFAPDSAETSMGTCEFMLTVLKKPSASQYMIDNHLSCIPYVIPGMYLTSLEVTTCGVLKNWTRDLLFSEVDRELSELNKSFYEDFIEERISNLRSDVLTLPQFGSSGNPNLSMNAVGTITGLTVHTKPEEIYLSIIEGITFQLRLAFEKLQPLSAQVNRIMATGGGAMSNKSLQVRADVFGIDVMRMRSQETGTLGCMLLAACACREFSDLEEGIRQVVKESRVFRPTTQGKTYYDKKYQRYVQLFELMGNFC